MSTTTKPKLEDAYKDKYATHQASSGINQLDEYKNLVNQKTSALSSVGNANKQAMKYADTTALSQGYATQGAMLQNTANLQNAYQNQVGGINQQFQQQLGDLKNTTSTNALTNYTNRLANIVNDTNLTQEQQQAEINKLQGIYYNQMNSNDINEAKLNTDDVIRALSGADNGAIEKDANDKVIRTSNQNANNVQYEVDFSKGSSHNNDIVVSINGENYQVELGKKFNNIAGSKLTDLEVKNEFKDRKVGEIWEYTTTGATKRTYLLIKDANGDVRALEKSNKAGNLKPYNALVSALGIEGEYRNRMTFGNWLGVHGTGQVVKK